MGLDVTPDVSNKPPFKASGTVGIGSDDPTSVVLYAGAYEQRTIQHSLQG